MILLIDGYNVIAPVAAPGQGASVRWLEVERKRLVDRLADCLPAAIANSTTVVFDAKNAPKDQPSRYQHRGIKIEFAVDFPEADDRLEEIILSHPAPQTLSVISSDHRIQNASRRRKAAWFDSDTWIDELLAGRVKLGWYPKEKQTTPEVIDEPQLSEQDVNEWLSEFSRPKRSGD